MTCAHARVFSTSATAPWPILTRRSAWDPGDPERPATALDSGRLRARYDKAIADCNRALRLNPNSVSGLIYRGKAQGGKKAYDLALKDFETALRLAPNVGGIYQERGLVRTAQKEYDKALEDFNKAIRLDAKSAAGFEGRGAAWVGKKEYDKAIKDFTEAIRLDPKSASALEQRGGAWEKKADYAKAMDDWNAALKLEPKRASAHNGRAWLLATCPDAKCRDGKQALESAQKACELSEWKEANHLGTLAAAYAEQGMFDEAVKWEGKAQEKLAADAPEKEEARKRLELYREKKPYRSE